MRTEVTVAMYCKCVDAGVCLELNTALPACTWRSEVSDKEDYPASCMSWFQLTEFATFQTGIQLKDCGIWLVMYGNGLLMSSALIIQVLPPMEILFVK